MTLLHKHPLKIRGGSHISNSVQGFEELIHCPLPLPAAPQNTPNLPVLLSLQPQAPTPEMQELLLEYPLLPTRSPHTQPQHKATSRTRAPATDTQLFPHLPTQTWSCRGSLKSYQRCNSHPCVSQQQV